MVRMDIIAGLKNAVERGYSLEQAKQSLRNSGYSEGDINEASNYLSGGFVNVQHIPQQNHPVQSIQTSQHSNYQYQNQQILQPKKQKWKISAFLILLILILFLLVSFLVLSLIFKDELIQLFKNLFG